MPFGDGPAIVHERFQEAVEISALDPFHDHGFSRRIPFDDLVFFEPDIFVRVQVPVPRPDLDSKCRGSFTCRACGSDDFTGCFLTQDYPSVAQSIAGQVLGPEKTEAMHGNHQHQSGDHQEACDQGTAGQPDQGVILGPP